ncbi:MAG: hypothetical protein M0Q38_15865 [Bacteroidales bacterium]|jgi:hypothetical protein|nr:hypothetical protein [Bacteroidales bacterium]
MLQKITIIPFLLFLFISACKKEKDDPYIRSNTVEIGDYTNMLRHIYDSVIFYQGLPAIIDLDMDNDKIADVRLISLMWGSVGLGHHPRSELYCLTENVSISGYYTSDTTFFSFDQSSYIGYDSIVNIDEYYRYSYHKISDHDTIVNIKSNSFKVLVQRQHDKINQQDVFKTDSIILIDESYIFPPYTIYKQDTVIRKYEVYYNDCNTFPLNDVNYLGIRIMNGNEIKYGWIKLSIIDKNKIIVFETTIQK